MLPIIPRATTAIAKQRFKHFFAFLLISLPKSWVNVRASRMSWCDRVIFLLFIPQEFF
ncbi:hypothetical protein [Synechocystis salina]|uniref:Transposase n=1 Tax=Synechocystis salina LEGE 00031 TaxID=1828736 RepID=A0ABR9VS65_9SYNC|nr:hypothetical protein [Synechocystis salina]MBE9241065.1 hypothetical protein [Synechocystis salina LEGE 00041]MBE9253086.1 hypothetical protein [Synechocystis salina LEGE 00031]